MAFNLGSISARLQLDSDGYTRGMLNAQSMNAFFGQSVTNFINNPILGTINLFKNAAKAVVSWSADLLSAAEAAQRLSVQTGLSTSTVQALRAEFELAGRPVTQAEQAMRTFNTRLAQARELGGPVADVFTRIGVSIDPLQNTDEVFGRVARALSEYGTVAESAAIAAQLFGEEAGGAVAETLATGGGIDAIVQKMQAFGRVTDEQGIDKMAALNTQMGLLGQGLSGLRQSLTTDFLSVLFEGFEDFDDEQMQEFIRTLRDDLKPTVEGAAEAIRAIAEAIRFLQDTFDGASDVVARVFAPGANTAWGRQQAYRDSDAMISGWRERRAARNEERLAAGMEVLPGQ